MIPNLGRSLNPQSPMPSKIQISVADTIAESSGKYDIKDRALSINLLDIGENRTPSNEAKMENMMPFVLQ